MNSDNIHQELQIDDLVCFNAPRSKKLKIGTIKKLTPQGVTIDYVDKNGIHRSCNRRNEWVIKISEQYQIAQEKYPEYFI